MLQLINLLAYTFAGVLAPLVLVASVLYRKRFRQVRLRWRKSPMVVLTIVLFVAALTLFVFGCFFFSLHFGLIPDLQLMADSPTVFFHLGLDCVLFLAGLVMLYLAGRNYLTQYITEEGIELTEFDFVKLRMRRQTLYWADVRDYFLHTDYPVTVFNFLVQTATEQQRHRIKVPYYARPGFEALVEQELELKRSQRQTDPAQKRNISTN